jgi:hypothetical protein
MSDLDYPKPEEYCQNCGGAKFTHVDFDKFIGRTIDDNTYKELVDEAITKKELYGNMCLEWKRDNLKYLETMSIKRLTEGQK